MKQINYQVGKLFQTFFIEFNSCYVTYSHTNGNDIIDAGSSDGEDDWSSRTESDEDDETVTAGNVSKHVKKRLSSTYRADLEGMYLIIQQCSKEMKRVAGFNIFLF